MKQKKSSKFIFDILAPDIKLNVQGKSSIHTKVGMFLSIIFAILFFTLSYIIVSGYFDTSKPRLSYEIKSVTGTPTLDLVKDKSSPILYFYYQEVNRINITELELFIHVELSRWTYYVSDDITLPDEGVKDSLSPVPCSDLINRGYSDTFVFEGSEFERQSYIRDGFCFDDSNNKMRIGEKKDRVVSYEYITLQFYPCIMGASCKDASELSLLTFSVVNPTAVTNLGKYQNPVSYETKDEEYDYLNTDSTQRTKFTMMRAQIWEDKGYLFGETMTHEYITQNKVVSGLRSRDENQLVCTQQEIDDTLCIPYYTQEFVISNSLQKIVREYKGVVEAMSEIGGLIKLILLIFESIYGFYHSRIFKGYLLDAIFSNDAFVNIFQGKTKRTEKVKKIYNTIKYHLDLITIAQEINNMKLLSSILIPEKAKAKVPYLVFEIENERSIKSKKEAFGESAVVKIPSDPPLFRSNEPNRDQLDDIIFEMELDSQVSNNLYSNRQAKITSRNIESVNNGRMRAVWPKSNPTVKNAKTIMKNEPNPPVPSIPVNTMVSNNNEYTRRHLHSIIDEMMIKYKLYDGT